jgi:hypothetical protein
LTGHFGISVVRETNLNLRTGHWLVIGSSTDLKGLLPLVIKSFTLPTRATTSDGAGSYAT